MKAINNYISEHFFDNVGANPLATYRQWLKKQEKTFGLEELHDHNISFDDTGYMIFNDRNNKYKINVLEIIDYIKGSLLLDISGVSSNNGYVIDFQYIGSNVFMSLNTMPLNSKYLLSSTEGDRNYKVLHKGKLENI